MRIVRQLIYIGDRPAILAGLRRRAVKVSRTNPKDVIYERILEISDEDGPVPELTDAELARVRELEGE